MIFDFMHICLKEFEEFWGKKEKIIGEFSPEFKSLINLMLAFDPNERPNVSKVLNHPWFSLDMPTEEEMVKELKIRDKIIKGVKEAEIQEQLRIQEELKAHEKKMARNKKQNGGNKIYRDGETLIGSSVEYISQNQEDQQISKILGKKIDNFIPGTNPYYFIINFKNTECILNRIADFLISEFK